MKQRVAIVDKNGKHNHVWRNDESSQQNKDRISNLTVAPAIQRRTAYGVPVPETFYHITLTSNLAAIQSQGLEPTIGERSEDLGEETPRIYLFDSMESVEAALSNWLGEYFEDDDISLITISSSYLEDPVPEFVDTDISWEWTSELAIPAEALSVVEDANL